MMETTGQAEKRIEIHLAIEMLHYANMTSPRQLVLRRGLSATAGIK